MHIPPVELAGILEGPVVGSFVGLIFGLFTLRFMADPRVVIPARLLIGIVSYLVYAGCGKKSWSIPLAAIAGSLTNTVGTRPGSLFGYMPLSGAEGAIGIALLQGAPEAIFAAVIITPVVVAVKRLEARKPAPAHRGGLDPVGDRD